nr:protein argonaute 12-like [Spinacia oleracea]
MGAPVSNQRLVLQLVAGLTKAYKTVGTNIRQSKVIPSFLEARSSLCLKEKGLAAMLATNGGGSAMIAAARDSDDGSDNSTHHNSSRGKRNSKGRKNGGGGRNSGGGHNRSGGHGSGGGGKNSGNGRGSGGGGRQNQQQQGSGTGMPWVSPWGWYPPWAMPPPPPCPYPSQGWTRPAVPAQQGVGLLGARPNQQAGWPAQHAYAAGYMPTDVEAAMHTMSMNPPDANWYMDTGATSHMTASQGNLTSYFNLSNKNGIKVVRIGIPLGIGGIGRIGSVGSDRSIVRSY